MFEKEAFLSTLTTRSGVYCMHDAAQKALYVGKAKNLKNRVASYFRTPPDPRVAAWIEKVASIDVTITYSEKEALLLENSLIKSLKPRYNVIFRDDKSYPYLFLSKHLYPQLVYFRGKQKRAGKYFGPYPSALAVKETLSILQKIFKLRQCDDLFFRNRSRPCLQYQIQRCSAPCVNYISPEAYAIEVENVTLFLEGKKGSLIDSVVSKMQIASAQQAFEAAAHYRDQITYLRTIYEQQHVQKQKGNSDVIAICELRGRFCVQLLTIRQGCILDSQTFYPKQQRENEKSHLLRGFLIQFYLDEEKKRDYPKEIILNEPIEDQLLIADVLLQEAQHDVKIIFPKLAEKNQWLQLAQENAKEALARQGNTKLNEERWVDLKKTLGLTDSFTRMECFDISHLQGEATMASCVVFDNHGPLKTEYRHYHLKTPPGDDYAAMKEVLIKRYLKRKAQDLPLPEIVVIDGGKGQLQCAKSALLECQWIDPLLVGIAKGKDRKPGRETLYVSEVQEKEMHLIHLAATTAAFHLLQHIRDEAHRFAVAGHRKKRAQRRQSPLEAVPGIGSKRRQKILNYFGGQQALLAASPTGIAQVPGISKALAEKIYQALHEK